MRSLLGLACPPPPITSAPPARVMLLRAGLFCAYTDGASFLWKVAPFSEVRMRFIYREIEGGSRRNDLNQYWSLIRPVLVAT